ncbi:MAG: hypothetical protein IT221_10030 [Fluviicola sp.]|nr:hypothetical protein [Fluviicola sp.]
MYTINVKNNYCGSITYDGTNYPSNSSFSTGAIGGFKIMDVQGIGPFTIIDLGETKLEGYPSLKETWGVLFRFQTVEIYARYEGGGAFDFVFDQYGDVEVTPTNGNAIPIKLPGMTIGTATPL